MLTDAYHLISRWSNHPRNIMNLIGTSNDGLTFSHTVTPIPCCDCTTVTCLNCQRIGHFNYECPDHQNSSLAAAPATTTVSEEDKAPVASHRKHWFKQPQHRLSKDSDVDSNLKICSSSTTTTQSPVLGSSTTINPLLMYSTLPNC